MSFIPDDLEPIGSVRDRVGEEALGVALASERLEAHFITDDGVICEIDAKYWCGKYARATIQDGKLRHDLIPEFHGAPVYVYEDEEVVSRVKDKGGRPPADWDAVFIAATCIAVTKGLPTTQAAFIDAIQTRLGDDAPSDTQMKTRIGPLFRELKKALSQSEI